MQKVCLKTIATAATAVYQGQQQTLNSKYLCVRCMRAVWHLAYAFLMVFFSFFYPFLFFISAVAVAGVCLYVVFTFTKA